MSSHSLALTPSVASGKAVRIRAHAGANSLLHTAPLVDSQADTLVDDLCRASCEAAKALRALRSGHGVGAAREYRRVLAGLQAASAKAQVVLWEATKANRTSRGRPIELVEAKRAALCA